MILERQRRPDGNILSDDVASLVNLSEALACLSSQGRRDPNSAKLRRRGYLFPMRGRESQGMDLAFPRRC
jgi:hypothetical protein